MRHHRKLFLRRTTWLIVVPQSPDLSRCSRDRIEEHRDIKIFFNEEPKRYLIGTLLSEPDISLFDCFCQSVPYLGYWLLGNNVKPGDVFAQRYDPDKIFLRLMCLCNCELSQRQISYYIRLGFSELTEFGIQDSRFVISRLQADLVCFYCDF